MCTDDGGVGRKMEGVYIVLEDYDHFLGSFPVSSEVILFALLGVHASFEGLATKK